MVATCSLYPSLRKSPFTLRKVMEGKKSLRSKFITTARRACGVALVRIERCRTKPCAGGAVSRRSRMFWSTHRWALARRGFGAEMERVPPDFLGIPKR